MGFAEISRQPTRRSRRRRVLDNADPPADGSVIQAGLCRDGTGRRIPSRTPSSRSDGKACKGAVDDPGFDPDGTDTIPIRSGAFSGS